MSESKRQFYRLTYPRSGRPVLTVQGRTFAVAEISEHGMRVLLQEADIDAWPIGETVCGQMIFSDGDSFAVVGEIVRHADTGAELQCALSLSEGIPYARMVAEQRFMMQIFPAAHKSK
ncbi:MAG: PilZ domain-containing protein [Fuerstiella sp.]|nr:PilZ domain-containing protein [Fuerstiella sp.]MCP4782496.1 PilZ domain-containing protein [Fuerstiella sp.]MCP4853661.1 PilZ domain-containing protein [Fuerstiella sp.]